MPDQIKKILIVEDEKIIALDIKNSVEKYGYTVMGMVNSGEEAISLAKSDSPDIILMDIHLEGDLDGIEAAEQIKKEAAIPIIFLTASTDEETLTRAKKTEPYGYINKPVKDIEIFTTLETALYKFRAELDLIQSERWLSAMLNGIGEGIISVDIDGMITYMNHVAEKMTGWKKEEAVGKYKNELMLRQGPDSRYRTVLLEENNSESVVIMLQNYILKSKYGQEVPVDVNNSSVLDINGDISGSIYSIRDITERKRTEEITKKAAEEWRVTFDSLTDSVFLVNEEALVIRCNKSGSHILGVGYEQIIGSHLKEIFGYIGDYIFNCFQGIKAGKATRIFQQRIGQHWYDGKFDPIMNHVGEFSGAVIILSDVTEKKKAQEELETYKNHLEELVDKRTDELKRTNQDLQNEISLRWLIAEQMVQLKEFAEAASRSKSEFLANMSHELRTPLNSIIGFAKLLKMGIDPEDADQYLTNIINSGNHLLTMINDILNLSKMEAGKLRIERSEMDIIQSVAVSVDIVSVQAEDKGIILNVRHEFEEKELIVYADEKRIQQVLLNLLSNAIKFTESEGSVTVNIRKNAKTCFVDVIDTGIGIDKNQQKAIFDKFSQVDNTLSKKNEGTGLGLAITKMLVESHNGHLYLSSKPNEGSTFTFSLPLYNRHKHGSSKGFDKRETYSEELRNKKILYIVNSETRITEAVEFFTNNKQSYSIIKRSTVKSETLKDKNIGGILVETSENIDYESKFIEMIKKWNDVPLVAISGTQNIEFKEVLIGIGYDLFYLIPVDFFDIVKDIESILGDKKDG